MDEFFSLSSMGHTVYEELTGHRDASALNLLSDKLLLLKRWCKLVVIQFYDRSWHLYTNDD